MLKTWLEGLVPGLGSTWLTIDGRALSGATIVVAAVGAVLVLVAVLAVVLLVGRWLRRRNVDSLLVRLGQGTAGFGAALLGSGVVLDASGVVGIREASQLAYFVANVELIQFAGMRVSPATLTVGGLILAVSLSVSSLAQRAVARGFQTRVVSADAGTVGAAQRLVHYTILAVGLAIALQSVGLDITALFAAGAVFAIGLGFAMQNIAENFVSGVILLIERAIKPGDVLLVDGQVVRVTQMGIRSTVARTTDDSDIILPNSILAQNDVRNYTMRDSTMRLRVLVGVTYGSDVEKVFATLKAVGTAFEVRMETPPPVVLLRDFGSSSVDFELSVWIDDPWNQFRIQSELRRRVWHALHEAGIVIAFPQLDLHLDPPVTEGLVALSNQRR